MDASELPTRLNQIPTLWTVVCQAHEDSGEQGKKAREELLKRYGGAIHRYLLGALRNADAAEDVAQEFAVRFLRGGLAGYNRDQGRFRDFVKGVLFHLVADYHKRNRRLPNQLPEDMPEPVANCDLAAERDQAFLSSWREDLLARVYQELERHEQETGQIYYTVLRFRADHGELRSADCARLLSAQLGKPMTDHGFRKTLERARDCFADLLLDEIASGLDQPNLDGIVEELGDLHLLNLKGIKEAVERRRP